MIKVALWILVIGLLLTSSELLSQNLRKQPYENNGFAKYIYSKSLGQHGIYKELKLFHTGRYTYFESLPLGAQDSSEGKYVILHDTLILNSDFQPGKLSVRVEYNNQQDSFSFKLPVNLNGDTCYSCFYYFNYDENKEYTPRTIYERSLPDTIKNFRVHFLYNDFSTDWISLSPSVNPRIIVLSNKNFDNYRNKVLTNYRFKLQDDVLIEIPE